jgi:HlyD family secretion protein
MTRRLILLLVVLALASGGGFYWWRSRLPGPTLWQGYADADFLKIGPTQQGLLVQVHVARGDTVAAGAPLFDQDDANDRAAEDQAARQLQQAEDQLANLQAPGKPTEIRQAAANLADAQAARDKLKKDLDRNQDLLARGAATSQIVDQERADLRSAEAKVLAMSAMLDQARAPLGRPGEVAAQQAAVDALRAALAMAHWRLDQRHVTAPTAGRIADVLARPGETMPAGGPVVSLLAPQNLFVRFFVPEPDLARIHLGERVGLVCDNCARGLSATISYIAPQAEYTPPVIYSAASRSKLVFLVEARPPKESAFALNPGEPVAVKPLPGPPAP